MQTQVETGHWPKNHPNFYDQHRTLLLDLDQIFEARDVVPCENLPPLLLQLVQGLSSGPEPEAPSARTSLSHNTTNKLLSFHSQPCNIQIKATRVSLTRLLHRLLKLCMQHVLNPLQCLINCALFIVGEEKSTLQKFSLFLSLLRKP